MKEAEKTALQQMHSHLLATKIGIEMMVAMLLHDGAMCHKCGYGTRVTSKRWAKCKRCGERWQRVAHVRKR